MLSKQISTLKPGLTKTYVKGGKPKNLDRLKKQKSENNKLYLSNLMAESQKENNFYQKYMFKAQQVNKQESDFIQKVESLRQTLTSKMDINTKQLNLLKNFNQKEFKKLQETNDEQILLHRDNQEFLQLYSRNLSELQLQIQQSTKKRQDPEQIKKAEFLSENQINKKDLEALIKNLQQQFVILMEEDKDEVFMMQNPGTFICEVKYEKMKRNVLLTRYKNAVIVIFDTETTYEPLQNIIFNTQFYNKQNGVKIMKINKFTLEFEKSDYYKVIELLELV